MDRSVHIRRPTVFLLVRQRERGVWISTGTATIFAVTMVHCSCLLIIHLHKYFAVLVYSICDLSHKNLDKLVKLLMLLSNDYHLLGSLPIFVFINPMGEGITSKTHQF